MANLWSSPENLAGITVGWEGFWRENTNRGLVTVFVLALILVWQFLRAFSKQWRVWRCARPVPIDVPETSRVHDSPSRISEIVSDVDLGYLINELEGKFSEKEKWEVVIDRKNHLLSYNAKCCKPKDGPLKYLSVTTFENCSAELLRDFYMDNMYRREWDRMLVEHGQLQVYEINGTEIGHAIKKFPLLTPREYVLAWRVWEGKDKSFYCFIKDCDHALAPRNKKYVRVRYFRSGWRIRKVPGRDACEIKLMHQEDACIHVEMAKLAFAKGIWSYVCKMDTALRKYSSRGCSRASLTLSALDLIQKVPTEVETMAETISQCHSESSVENLVTGTGGETEKKFLKKPSKKWITRGLLVLGGVICLSRGNSQLVKKVAMICLLKKLVRHGDPSSQAAPSRARTNRSK